MPDFAARLKQLRTTRNLRQVDLATAIGVAQTTIANYEQHNRFPDEETLLKLADHFAVSLDYLLGRSEITVRSDDILRFRADEAAQAHTLTPAARDYLTKLLEGNKREAFDLVIERVRNGVTVGEIYRTVLEPSLREVGRLWETNEISIGKEHYFSRATESLMGQLYGQIRFNGRRCAAVVLVTAGAEQHDLGLRMVSDLLEADGYRCVFLGPGTPAAEVMSALRDSGAAVLAISATLPANVDSVQTMVQSIRTEFDGNRLDRRPRIVVGGRAFNLDPTLWRRVGADSYAEHADAAVTTVNELLSAR